GGGAGGRAGRPPRARSPPRPRTGGASAAAIDRSSIFLHGSVGRDARAPKSIIARVPVLEPGARFPDLALTDDGGAPFPAPRGETLYAVFKTTCPTCEFTWPFLDRIRAVGAGGGLAVVAVSQDDPNATHDFGRRLGPTPPPASHPSPCRACTALGADPAPPPSHPRADGPLAETVVGFDRPRLERLADRAARPAGGAPAPLFRPDETVPA